MPRQSKPTFNKKKKRFIVPLPPSFSGKPQKLSFESEADATDTYQRVSEISTIIRRNRQAPGFHMWLAEFQARCSQIVR